jgi:hypothetical protein
MFGSGAAIMAGAGWAHYATRLELLEKALDRVVDFVADRLEIVIEDELPGLIKELLAKDQFEVAVIEYRRATGADLESAFHAVQNGGKLDLATKVDRLLKDIDRMYPARPKTQSPNTTPVG